MHGWNVDRDGFDRLLTRHADTAGVRVLDDFRLGGIARTAGGWSIADRLGSSPVQCRFLVDASGRSAIVSRALAIRRRRLDRACAAHAVTSASTDVLTVSSAPYGWWYSTPVSGTRAITAVVSDGDILRRLGAAAPTIWSALAAREGIDVFPLDGVVRTRSCGTAFLEQAGGSAWLAVGDAALCSDPLDGHGIHRALRSGRLAGKAIIRAIRGSRGALGAFRAAQSSEVRAFVKLQRRQYEMEARWSQGPFWSRRVGALRQSFSSPYAGGHASSR
jgi:flavin-dependent dehydrogenase